MSDFRSFTSLFVDFNTYPKRLEASEYDHEEHAPDYYLHDMESWAKYKIPEGLSERIPSANTHVLVRNDPPQVHIYDRMDVVQLNMQIESQTQ